MKKNLALLLCLAMVFCLFGCGQAEAPAQEPVEESAQEAEAPAQESTQEESVELIVFAAASMTETLNEIAGMYKEAAPNVELVFNFDSSGTLQTQIEEGADCDLFISAAPKQMNALDGSLDAEGGNTDGQDYVLQGTRIDLLENKVALAVPEGNPAGIESYDDMVAGLQGGSILLAMGNSDVPVGQYTQKIFAYFGLDEEELAAAGCITYGSNVKEVTTQVTEGAVDCGIIYQTDAFSDHLTVVDTATAEMCGQVVYPAAVMKVSKNPQAAKDFLSYLTSEAGDEVFAEVGFTPIG